MMSETQILFCYWTQSLREILKVRSVIFFFISYEQSNDSVANLKKNSIEVNCENQFFEWRNQQGDAKNKEK